MQKIVPTLPKKSLQWHWKVTKNVMKKSSKIIQNGQNNHPKNSWNFAKKKSLQWHRGSLGLENDKKKVVWKNPSKISLKNYSNLVKKNHCNDQGVHWNLAYLSWFLISTMYYNKVDSLAVTLCIVGPKK